MSYNNGMNERGFTVQDYKDSISADNTNEMFTLAYQWQDKKHRHIWDLCNWIEQLQAENVMLREALKYLHCEANDLQCHEIDGGAPDNRWEDMRSALVLAEKALNSARSMEE